MVPVDSGSLEESEVVADADCVVAVLDSSVVEGEDSSVVEEEDSLSLSSTLLLSLQAKSPGSEILVPQVSEKKDNTKLCTHPLQPTSTNDLATRYNTPSAFLSLDPISLAVDLPALFTGLQGADIIQHATVDSRLGISQRQTFPSAPSFVASASGSQTLGFPVLSM